MEVILIAGGTGLLGRALAGHLAGRGFQVVILSRHGGSLEASEGPIRVRAWRGAPTASPEPWEDDLAGAAAVINLAGRSVNCRYTRAHRREILESRLSSTRALAAALARCPRPPQVWLNSSTATIYEHTFGAAHDEAGCIGPTPEAHDAFSLEVATAWERAFFEADVRPRKVALRTAIVLSNRPGNMVPILRRLTRLGAGGKMGDGRQWVSWIHERDFCRGVEFILGREDLCGPVNVAAPYPLTNAEMMHTFREVFHRPVGLPAARWMLAAGAWVLRTEPELVLKSRRVVPGKLLAAGFAFQFPVFAEALRDLACAGGNPTTAAFQADPPDRRTA